MKKTIWTVLIGALFLLVSCQSDEDFSMPAFQQSVKSSASHFYGVKQVDNQSELRGIAQRNKLWNPGTVISVKLLNDPYNMKQNIKSWAAEWEQYANISFDFVTSGDAEVRIGFDWNDSKWITWSYTGTDCKYVTNQNEATLNFAFWDMASEQEMKADVFRAFGQVLGLELEHRHLSFDAGWSSRIQQYWEGEIEDIPWAELKKYVFDPIEAKNLEQTKEYDENSIMVWPFDRRYATNTARDYNYDLSEKDKEFIKYLYPGGEEQLCFVMKKCPSPYYSGLPLEIGLYKKGSVRVVYEDGRSDAIFESDAINNIRLSTGASKVYGDPNNIRSITQWANGLYSYELSDMSRCKELTSLSLNLETESYDFLSFPKLEELSITGLNIKEIDISKLNNLKSLSISGITKGSNAPLISNSKLESLTLSLPNIRSLDIQNLPNLLSLKLDAISLNEIDLSENKLLESLDIRIYSDTDIDLSKNLNLKSLTLDNRTESINLSNNIKLNSIYLKIYCYFNENKAIEFANNLPTVLIGTIRGSSNSNISLIKDIAESKGWTVK